MPRDSFDHVSLGCGIVKRGQYANCGDAAVEAVVPDPILAELFTLVATAEAIGGAVNALEFTGLDGDTDGTYCLEFYLKDAINGNTYLQINDDGVGKSRRHTVNSSTGTFATTMIISQSSGIGDISDGSLFIHAPKTLAGIAKTRRYRCSVTWDDASTNLVYRRIHVGEWPNSADNITKIALAFSLGNAGIAEGSWARLYKYEA